MKHNIWCEWNSLSIMKARGTYCEQSAASNNMILWEEKCPHMKKNWIHIHEFLLHFPYVEFEINRAVPSMISNTIWGYNRDYPTGSNSHSATNISRHFELKLNRLRTTCYT